MWSVLKSGMKDSVLLCDYYSIQLKKPIGLRYENRTVVSSPSGPTMA